MKIGIANDQGDPMPLKMALECLLRVKDAPSPARHIVGSHLPARIRQLHRARGSVNEVRA